MERLQRWRETAVVVVLVVLAVRLLLVVVAALVPGLVGVEARVDAAYLVSAQLGDATLFVLLAALVGTCHLAPVTPRARTLTLAALVLAGSALLVVLVLAGLGYASFPSPLRRIELASRLVGLVLPLLAVVALALMLTRGVAARLAVAGSRPGAEAEGSAGEAPAIAPAPSPDPALQPTWAVDEAAGAAWLSADDAASGRPAAGWGSAEHDTGWGAAAPAGGAEPTRPSPGTDPAAAGPRPHAETRQVTETGPGTGPGPVAASGPADEPGLVPGPGRTGPAVGGVSAPPAPPPSDPTPPHPWSRPTP